MRPYVYPCSRTSKAFCTSLIDPMNILHSGSWEAFRRVAVRKKIPEDIKDNAILVYDNEPRNKEIIKKIEEVIDLGYRVCIWNDKRITEYKDINDMIMSGLSESEVVDIINSNTVYGLSAKLQLMEYKKT